MAIQFRGLLLDFFLVLFFHDRLQILNQLSQGFPLSRIELGSGTAQNHPHRSHRFRRSSLFLDGLLDEFIREMAKASGYRQLHGITDDPADMAGKP